MGDLEGEKHKVFSKHKLNPLSLFKHKGFFQAQGRTAKHLLSTVGVLGRGVRAISMTNKMVRFIGSSSSPKPG